jgi:hypothetical protein
MNNQRLSFLNSFSAQDFLISPKGEYIPFVKRGLEVQKVFNLTPVQFQNRFNVPADSALISKGYIYVNGGLIQAGTISDSLNRNQINLIVNYLKTLQPNSNVEIMLLRSDPNSFKLIDETLFYQGTTQGAFDKLLNTPSKTWEPYYPSAPNYQFVPQQGNRGNESSSPAKGESRTFGFPIGSINFSMFKLADILQNILNAPSERIELTNSKHYGLPVIKIDGESFAIATEEEATKAAEKVILDSVWLMSSSWLSHIIPLDKEAIDAIQQTMEERANPVLRFWIRDEQDFVRKIIYDDGRAYWISDVDGDEHDLREYNLNINNLPKEVLRALGINRGYEGNIYLYKV